MNKTKSISEYGYNFQVKFIVCLITDKLFLEQIIDILDEKYLGNEEINQDGDLFRYSKVHLDKINNIQALEVALWGDLYEILHDTY